MNETATTIDAAAPALPRLRHAAAELDRRLFVAGVAACTGARRRVPPRPALGLAAARGRDAAAVRRPAAARRPLRHRPRQARRGAAPLPDRLDRWRTRAAGCTTMRLFSALFAVASVPAIAILGNRLAGRGPALAAACSPRGAGSSSSTACTRACTACSCSSRRSRTSPCSARLDRGGTRAWTLWAIVMLLAIGSHPYGALVLGSQAAYVVLTRSRLRQAVVAFGVVLLLAIPLWRSSVVLANRLDVGVGRRRRQAAHAAGGVRVPLARRRRRVDRLRRRPRDRPRCSRCRPRLAGAETTPQRAPHRLRGDHADALLPRRPVRRELGARVAPPDLRAAVLRPRGRERDRGGIARGRPLRPAARRRRRAGDRPRGDRLGVAQDSGSVRAREPGPRRRPPRGRRVARGDLTARRRAFRLRARLPRGLGEASARRSRGRSCPAPTPSSRSRHWTRPASRSGAASGRSTPATTTTP